MDIGQCVEANSFSSLPPCPPALLQTLPLMLQWLRQGKIKGKKFRVRPID